jgi:hypothetical protein
MRENQKIIAGCHSRYRNAARKERAAALNEARLVAGCNRICAPRVLNKPEAPQYLLAVNGGTVKFKPPKKEPSIGRAKKFIAMMPHLPRPPLWAGRTRPAYPHPRRIRIFSPLNKARRQTFNALKDALFPLSWKAP